MDQKLNAWARIILFVLLLGLITVGSVIFYFDELHETPIVEEKMRSADYGYLYNFYALSRPNTEGRGFYGSENASISIIAYLDFESPESKGFVEELLPQLKKEYITTGKAKLFQKNYITIKDIEEKSSRYIYAATLVCVESISKESQYPFYFDLFSISSANEIPALLQKYGIPQDLYQDCLSKRNDSKLLEDASEVEAFGMQGSNQRFYIGLGQDYSSLDGIPSYDRFKRELRASQIMLGD
jgi:hypothetical protein